jgi:hypothetical protein
MVFITDSGSSKGAIKMIASSEAIGRELIIRELEVNFAVGALKFWGSSHSQALTDSEMQFEEQKRLFEQIPPLFLEPYRGLFVISHNGQIVDADEDLDVLTSRFIAEHGNVPMFLGKIGGQLREVIDTHF